jgi:anti-sigma regulatory factor (Ser/Thr protein kinase)
MHQRLPAQPQSVPLIRRSVSEFAAAAGASAAQLSAIAIAVSEAVTNAVVHAYVGHDAAGLVAIDAHIAGGVLHVSVCDEAIGMRPRLDSPGIGLGLGLIASVSDTFTLDETHPGVRVSMTFAIG